LVRIASQTSFGGVDLLNGTYTASFQVGADAGQLIEISVSTNFATVVGTAGGIDTFANAQTAITKMDSALAVVNGVRADLGAKQNRFSSVIRSNDNTAQNVSASRSRVEDADMQKSQLS
jgi:flagellin